VSITRFAIRHHMAVLLLCVGILVIGSFVYMTMPRESFPDVEFPFVIITTVLDGANPTDIEESVTIPIETELDGIEGMKEMRSSSMDSMSMISIEFLPGVDTEVALSRVRSRVDQAKPDMSPDAEEPVVEEFTLTSTPVLIYELVGGGNVARSELDELAEKIEDDLRLIPEVLDVDVFGGREDEIVIEVDPQRTHFYALSLQQVQSILQGTNRNVSAGTINLETKRVVMRVPGEFENPAEIMNLVIGFTGSGTPVYLHDVGTARYDFDEETSRARIYDFSAGDGENSVNQYVEPHMSISLQIMKRSGANILDMCEKAADLMESYPFPSGVRAVKSFDQSKFVRMMVSDLQNGIATSLILVLAVIFIGLGLRNAILVATAIPFSMLLSIVILSAMGETMNMMVLFSLILALGMLVDNAIVIVENIYRHHAMGVPRAEAALVGTGEVAWPVITSTATTVAAFFPLLFWPGIMGEFMGHLPRTVITVLVSSLFVALVINPTLAALVMKVKPGAKNSADPETQRPNYWLVLRYQRLLEFLLRRPRWTATTALVLLVFVFTLYGSFGAGVEFFPKIDPDTLTCSVRPPEGISLDSSDDLSRAMENRIFGAPGSGWDKPVQNLKTASVVVGLEGVGGPSGGFGEEGIGPIRTTIEFVDSEFRTESTTTTLNELRRRMEGINRAGERVAPPLYGADFDVIRPQEGPPTGKPVSIDIFGDNLNQMARVIYDMKNIIRNVPGTVKPTDDAVTAQPTLEWRVDRARAGMLGLSQAMVAGILQVAGDGLNTGTFGHGDDEQDIMLRFPERFRIKTSRLKNITIPMNSGAAVPIASVAAPDLVPGPVTIKHYNKKRVLNAAAEIQPEIRADASIREMFQQRAKQYPFPPGITYRFGKSDEEQQAAVRFLSKAFIIAVFTIVMVLVLQFNSLLKAGIVMVSVVLSLMGVYMGLLVLNAPFGIIMTGIGCISLAGVVVNNAIVMIDAIHQFQDRGDDTYTAVVSAAMVRFRPVLLTAITTILGLVPMALKLNFDFTQFTFQYNTSMSQWWQSMALAVIFGLLVSTILTLGVVPTLYLLQYKARGKLRKLPLLPHKNGTP
jgi:multidrug efflux pump